MTSPPVVAAWHSKGGLTKAMDPDLVRLILVLLGVLLVVGIYLWDRYKRAVPRVRRMRSPRIAPPAGEEWGEADTPVDEEPAPGVSGRPIQEVPPDEADRPPTPTRKGHRRDADIDPDPSELGEWSPLSKDADPQMAMELNFDAHGDGDYLSTDPALYDEVERKIVVVNLVAGDGHFSGPAIAAACAEVGLVLGDMSIYHRHDERTDRVLFSMASMVEPGTFPAEATDAFETPGLSMFTQLPGPRDGLEIYELMLGSAKRLAGLLNAGLQDERHNKLTRQMEEHTRESIIEHRRKVRLARSRH